MSDPTRLDQLDWSRLGHAYGTASDTPGHLANLVAEDEKARAVALDHLWGAVLHQGTPYSVTARAAVTVAELLGDRHLDAAARSQIDKAVEVPPQSLRAALLDFLAGVGEACSFDQSDVQLNKLANPTEPVVSHIASSMVRGEWSDDWPDGVIAPASEAVYARSVLACRQVASRLLAAVMPFVSDPDPAIRVSAANAAAKLAGGPGGASARAQIVDLLEVDVRSAPPAHRAALALSLADLEFAPRWMLEDSDAVVRACAALSPALASEPRALGAILDALRDSAAVDEALPTRTPQLEGRLRFRLVAAAIDRAESFEQLLPAAVAVASVAHKYTVDSDWGPLLRAAFPTKVQPGERLTSAQRSFLNALVANDTLWDPRFGNPDKWFTPAGLPYDRGVCRSLSVRGRV